MGEEYERFYKKKKDMKSRLLGRLRQENKKSETSTGNLEKSYCAAVPGGAQL